MALDGRSPIPSPKLSGFNIGAIGVCDGCHHPKCTCFDENSTGYLEVYVAMSFKVRAEAMNNKMYSVATLIKCST